MNELFTPSGSLPETAALQFLCNFSTIIMFFIFTRAITELRFKKRITIIISALYYVVIFMLSIFFLPSGDQGLSLWSILFTAFLPTIILLHITSRGSFFQIVTMWSIGIIFFYVITLSGLYVRLANHSVIADLLVRIIIFVPILILVFRFIRKPALEFTHSIHKYWSFIWLLPFSIAVLLTYLIYSPINILIYPGNIPPAVALLAISIFSIAVLYLIFRETGNSIRHQRDGELMKTQLEAQKKQFVLQEENIRLTKMYRHDMRHHIAVISDFLQKGETQKALLYLHKTQSSLENMTLEAFCSHSAANAVLSSYHTAALQKGIDMCIHAEIPDKLSIDETELCAVLANCVENAVCACANLPAQKQIDILVKYTPGVLAMQIKNPYTGTIDFDNEGLPLSTHPEGGIGIRSVLMIVQKYSGVLTITADDGIYTIRGVLNEIKK